jgi:hypothetical protein
VGYVKLNFSLTEEVALTLRRRAAEANMPVSQFLGHLIIKSERQRTEELAEEGYRLLSAESLNFANSASPLAGEVWSDW